MRYSPNEINADEQRLPFFIDKDDKSFALYLRCNDQCGLSWTGNYDYHWSYSSLSEAKREGQKLSA